MTLRRAFLIALTLPWATNALSQAGLDPVETRLQELKIEERKGDRVGVMNGKWNVAIAMERAGRYREAISYSAQCVSDAKKLNQFERVARSLDRLAVCANYIGDRKQALSAIDEAAKYAALAKLNSEFRGWLEICKADYTPLGSERIRLREQFAFSRTPPNSLGLAKLAWDLYLVGRKPLAQKYMLQAIDSNVGIDPSYQFNESVRFGNLLCLSGDYSQGLQWFKKSDDYEQHRSVSTRARVNKRIYLARHLNTFEERIRVLQAGERIALDADDLESLSRIRAALVGLNFQYNKITTARKTLYDTKATLGASSTALVPRFIQQVAPYLMETDQQGFLLESLWEGYVLSIQHSPDTTIQLLELLALTSVGDPMFLARKAVEQARPGYERVRAQRTLAMVLLEAEELNQAKAEAEKAVALARDSTTIELRHSELVLANVLRAQGRSSEALPLIEAAVDEIRTVDAEGQLASAVNSLIRCLVEVGEHEKALGWAKTALSIPRYSQGGKSKIDLLAAAGLAREAGGDISGAMRDYQTAIIGIERRRAMLAGYTATQMQAFKKDYWVYQRLLMLMLDQGQTESAYNHLQKMKGRTVLDLAVNEERALSQGEIQLSGRIGELDASLKALTERYMAESVRGNVEAATRLSDQLRAVEAEVRAAQDRFSSRRTDVKPVSDWREIASKLESDAALLDYVLIDTGFSGARRQKAVVFTVTNDQPGPKVQVTDLTIALDQISRGAQDLALSLSVPSGDWKVAANALAKLLPGDAIRGKATVLLSPDQTLNNVALHVLPDPEGGRPIGLSRQVSYLYSASSLVAKSAPARANPTSSIFVVYNPEFAPLGSAASASLRASTTDPLMVDGKRTRAGFSALPGTASEAAAIKSVFPDGHFVSGPLATQDAVEKLGMDARYLHFATHGIINRRVPLLSCLVLAPHRKGGAVDNYLTAQELLNLPLKAELVTLSACDTGRGSIEPGEGTLGLAWALFARGVRTQVLSLWEVDDKVTSDLMGQFYNALKEGSGKAAALKIAMQGVETTHPHPYYWAPFVCMGDPN